MGLINAEQILEKIADYRLLWIKGKTSGGKTSLAYRFAYHFLKQGYRLVTNNLSVWADPLCDVNPINESGHLKSVVLLDEGGRYLRSNRMVEDIASFPAKMDMIYITSSFWPPARAMRLVTVQAMWNMTGLFLPLYFYRWRIKCDDYVETGNFWWWRPREIFGVYSRQDPGSNAAEIVQWCGAKTEEYLRRYGREDKNILSEVGGVEQNRSADTTALEEAAESFESAADRIAEAIPFRKSKRKGW